MIDWTDLDICLLHFLCFLNGIFYQAGGLFVVLVEDTDLGELEGGTLLCGMIIFVSRGIFFPRGRPLDLLPIIQEHEI